MASSSELGSQANRAGLRRVGTRPGLFPYLRTVWGAREFIGTLARYRVLAENERQRLGMLWIVLKPVFDALIYGIVFGIVLGASKPRYYAAFLVIGVFVFSLFRNCMSRGARSLTTSSAFIRSIRFPRMALPAAETLRELINFAPVLAIMLVVVLFFGGGASWKWLLLVPAFALYALFCFGVSCLFARLNAVSRDVQNVVPVIARVFLWGSGVFFSVEKVIERSSLGMAIFNWTPLAPFLGLFRGILIAGYAPTAQQWAACVLWTVLLCVGGVIFFWEAEERYGQYV
ncbi:MAG: ABC transporter permease [Microbacteriaceae bacterium]|jgi:teichoic acid transport system permease protein|nr:ABC transporter permease [Microbacteriaceae bacterium]